LQQKKEKNEQKARDEEQRKQELFNKKQIAVSDKNDALCELINEH